MTEQQVALPEGQPREDLDALYREALSFAVRQLADRGVFYPFGLALRAQDGKVVRVPIETEVDRPTADDVVHILLTALREYAAAGELTAAVVVTDITMAHPQGGPDDAVMLAFEHRETGPFTMIVPYVTQSQGVLPELAPAFAISAQARVFG